MMASNGFRAAISSISHVEAIYSAAIGAVSPVKLVSESLHYNTVTKVLTVSDVSYPLNRNVKVVAFGKAVLGMVTAIESLIGEHIVEGVASIPVGAVDTAKSNFPQYLPPKTSKVRICEGARNNLPDECAESAAREILDLVKRAGDDELIIALISGGGSALLPCPIKGVALDEKKQVITSLSKHGADIYELNSLRTVLSETKGGKLALAAYPTKLVSLILSDVIGDPLETIASGPTVPRPTVPNHTDQRNVVEILDKYQLTEKVPESIMSHLGRMKETKNDTVVPVRGGQYTNTQNVLVGTNQIALTAALQTAQSLGYSSYIWSRSIQGEARELGEMFAMIAHDLLLKMEGKVPLSEFPKIYLKDFSEDMKNNLTSLYSSCVMNSRQICMISGGEPTVTVRGSGKGGRSQELALAFAIRMRELRSFVDSHCLFASIGTDGQDGPCDAAGAWVDETVIDDALRQKLDPLNFLENNDSYNFFSKLNNSRHLIKTGLTGTNVMDVHVLLLNV